ncbi:MAG: hypothetical protein MI784_06390 [Cytophagales bacterium]|nr:hypothetical protein [Cytophagales bacterium]
MEIKKTNACINCDNLMQNSLCRVNNIQVSFDQTCENFSPRLELHRDSECGNCSKYNQESCAHPAAAAEGMLCTDYKLAQTEAVHALD